MSFHWRRATQGHLVLTVKSRHYSQRCAIQFYITTERARAQPNPGFLGGGSSRRQEAFSEDQECEIQLRDFADMTGKKTEALSKAEGENENLPSVF